MPNQQLFYLNLIHGLVCFPLIILHVYLLTISIIQKLHDCNRGFYTNCLSIDESLRSLLSASAGDSLFTDHHKNHTRNNLDWIGLDQYALQLSLLLVILFGLLSVYLRKRRFIFIAILFYLINLIQILLIEITDDRDFPSNIFRHGNSKRQYALLYLNYYTYGALILKIIFLLLLGFEFLLLVSHFVLLRYVAILNDQTLFRINQQQPQLQ